MPSRPPTDFEHSARCIGCGYVVEGLDEDRCPECGRPFDLDDPKTFSYKPPLLWWRLWLPAFALAFIAGGAVFAVLIAMGSLAWGLAVATPIMIGALVGYRCRLSALPKTVLSISVGIGILTVFATLNVTGVLCTLIAAVIITPPILLGAVAGILLKRELKRRGYDQAAHLPIVLIIAVPVVIGVIERLTAHPFASETVQSSRVIPLEPEDAWERLTYYEDLPDDRPWLLQWAGPVPVRTYEDRTNGDVRRVCVYQKGRIVKRITDVDPPRRLAFRVTEQSVGEERSVWIENGAFELEPVGANQTRVTLTTRYRPKLSPRPIWRPFERLVCHSVHSHVLNGIDPRTARPPQAALAGEASSWSTSR